MKVVSIGDLVTDYYYKNGKLLGVNGGMTSHNIIANLSKLNIPTSVFGVCGDDATGDIAIKSLKDLNVDITNIHKLPNIKTRCFHVSYTENKDGLSFTSKKRCPFCNHKNWYEDSLINVDDILQNIGKTDILVFDNLNSKNQEIIDRTPNLKLIDLGQYFEFDHLSNQEIINKIKDKFTIINMNERVAKYFTTRFNLSSNLELYSLFKAKLITITAGKEGAKFIYNNKIFHFQLEKIIKEVDATGAGDAFFASIIHDWIKNDLKLEENQFKNWYHNSCKTTAKVVQKMSARGHLNKIYKIKGDKLNCTCNSFSVSIRKPIKRCNININNLQSRVINALNSNAPNALNNINFNEKENYFFVGTGGSFAAANFASMIINKMYGSNTYAIYPRDISARNNSNINKVILFSYSGTTNDLLEGTKFLENQNKYIITKGSKQKIVTKTMIPSKNIISYRTNSNKGKERGFLSFEGAVSPAAIFLQYYNEKNTNNINIETFIKQSLTYWDEYFQEKFQEKNIRNIFQKGNIINIFTGDYTKSASIDFESKIIESGIINCLIHEKKNFSHGRFINYENLDNKKSIYFKQHTTSLYEEKLLEYLKEGTNLIIESKYDEILCEFDLLIASQLLIYHIGKLLNVDMSKPNYSENAMNIYFYKGEL